MFYVTRLTECYEITPFCTYQQDRVNYKLLSVSDSTETLKTTDCQDLRESKYLLNCDQPPLGP